MSQVRQRERGTHAHAVLCENIAKELSGNGRPKLGGEGSEWTASMRWAAFGGPPRPSRRRHGGGLLLDNEEGKDVGVAELPRLCTRRGGGEAAGAVWGSCMLSRCA